MFQNIGPVEWLVLIGLVLILVRPARVGEVARSLGRAISEFKKGLRDEDEEKKKPSEDKKDSPN